MRSFFPQPTASIVFWAVVFLLLPSSSVVRLAHPSIGPLPLQQVAFGVDVALETISVAVTDGSGEPVGQIRLERDGSSWVISLAVAPAARGRGYATCGVELAVASLREYDADPIHAYLREENAASLRAFASAGFSAPGPAIQQGVDVLRMTLR